MNRVTIMADYLGYELGKAEIDNLQYETEYNRYVAQLYLSTRTSNKKYAVLVDPAANRLQDRLNTSIARVTLLRSMVEARDRQYKALSRDQTRRQGQYDKRGSY